MPTGVKQLFMKKTPEQLRNEFWSEDIKKGGLIYNQYNQIKDVIQKEDVDWVMARYKDIKQHAIDNTEFYKSYSADDEFPVVDKMSILKNYDSHKAKSNYDTPIHISSTSGSTGTPFSVIQNFTKRNRNIADLKVFGELCDYPSHERMVFFRVLSEKLRRTPEQEERENIFYVDSSDLGVQHLEQMRCVLLDKKPRIVFSYASTLVELAKYIQISDTAPEEFGITSVLTAGEGLSEENRKILEKAFGAKVYRRYSDMELGILGQDNGDGGAYRLNFGSYFFECLKVDSDQPAAEGEVGRIVITDLFNYAFPMIRYDTGDLGIMSSGEGAFPVLKEIYGRKRDCVYSVDGRLISPAKISVSMWGADNINQWQFIQETQNKYTLKLNVSGEASVEQIIEKFKGILGIDAIIEVEFVDEIPVISSNKRRAVICNYIP